MNYKEKIKIMRELVAEKERINKKIYKQQDILIDSVHKTLAKKLSEDIDIDNEVSIHIYEKSIEIGLYRDIISTEVIKILQDIFGEGEINCVDNEFYMYFYE